MKTYIPKYSILIIGLLFLFGCQKNTHKDDATLESDKLKLFELLASEKSNITFNNSIQEDLTFNYLRLDGIYHGGGVGTGDINNDGLTDLYFAGNMVPDRLYLNKGDMRFEDITDKAGIMFNPNDWSTGVSFGDVNNDGFLDIYVCKFLVDDPQNRKNRLYINNGDLTFTEKAEAFGLAEMGYSIQATFIDYNKDGWLDLYVANQPPNSAEQKKKMKNTINYLYTDRLYRNNGNNTFTDVTKSVGLENFSYTLSAIASDINNDGWADFYIANDYEEPDALMINNGNGTFRNVTEKAIRHMSNFSMGADIADINNDGWPDVYIPDMVAKDNYRIKTNMSGMNPERFWELVKRGYQHQYMFNALQLNNGNNTFSEIAQLSGVSNTDWTWGSLLADFDNDGFKDLHSTNGQLRDIRNKDYEAKMKSFVVEQQQKGVKEFNPITLIEMANSNRISNYIYKNNGDLTFTDKTDAWGHEKKTFSQGALYADLDNDGDLDLVINNMNDPASIYKNLSAENNLNNYLRIKLKGAPKNPFAVGTKATIELNNENIQVQELYPNRGYMSNSEFVLHFGLGKNNIVSKLTVDWPNGEQTVMTNVKANQVLNLNITDANSKTEKRIIEKTLFSDVSADLKLSHVENEFDDYKREVLLPHKMSTLGPVVAVADINKDGIDDFYYGASAGQAGTLMMQTTEGKFNPIVPTAFLNDKKYEDSGALFFDSDGDGDLDLYVVSGGNEQPKGSSVYLDRLYINAGDGSFSKSKGIIPELFASGGAVAASDIDNDGDLDLFVGGRQVPGEYGINPNSYILENTGGKFTDATEKFNSELKEVGMVTDAVWFDFDGDNDEDLFIVGEWMGISCFKNETGKLVNVSEQVGLKDTEGWWNRLVLADMDKDGDLDLIAGNLGLNIKYKASKSAPFKLYAKDFDGNGTHDIYLGYYEDETCYPVRGRQCSSQQMPFIKEKFKNYNDFALASIDEVLGERLSGAEMKEAKLFESCYIENLGGGNFSVRALPLLAQIAPIYGIIPNDWNNDGILDLLIAGNYYNREVETTRSDAGIGQILIGNGKGGFSVLAQNKTGVLMNKDVRALALLNNNKDSFVLVANNNENAQLYKLNK